VSPDLTYLGVYYCYCLLVFPQPQVHLIIYFNFLGINWNINSEEASWSLCWHNIFEETGKGMKVLPQFILHKENSETEAFGLLPRLRFWKKAKFALVWRKVAPYHHNTTFKTELYKWRHGSWKTPLCLGVSLVGSMGVENHQIQYSNMSENSHFKNRCKMMVLKPSHI
jgi:hypothetical protein